MKLFIAPILLVTLGHIAIAEDKTPVHLPPVLGQRWPPEFGLFCGDFRADSNEIVGRTLAAKARMMNPVELPDSRKNGIGYKLNLTIDDKNLTGQQQPVQTTASCYSDNKMINQNEPMTCFVDLQSLPGKPGFARMLLKLMPPNFLNGVSPISVGGNEIGIRYEVPADSGTNILPRFYKLMSELNCHSYPTARD